MRNQNTEYTLPFKGTASVVKMVCPMRYHPLLKYSSSCAGVRVSGKWMSSIILSAYEETKNFSQGYFISCIHRNQIYHFCAEASRQSIRRTIHKPSTIKKSSIPGALVYFIFRSLVFQLACTSCGLINPTLTSIGCGLIF